MTFFMRKDLKSLEIVEEVMLFWSKTFVFIYFPEMLDIDFKNGKYIGYIAGNLSMGQILSIIMFIAGLGIGGLAIALAAKESLENLLGS